MAHCRKQSIFQIRQRLFLFCMKFSRLRTIFRLFRKQPVTGAILSQQPYLYPSPLVELEVPPTILWVSDPVEPGEIVLIFGDGFGLGAKVLAWPISMAGGEGRSLSILQHDLTCLKVVLPAEWERGCFRLQVCQQEHCSHPLIVNRPEIWWVLSRLGNSAVAGESLRLFGKNLCPDLSCTPQGQLQDQDSGQSWDLELEAADRYTLTFHIPYLEPGSYQIQVHNGIGANSCWSACYPLSLIHPECWPTTLFDVTTFGATSNGAADDTDTITKALAMAADNGGGIIYFPAGCYRITAPLRIPPRTVLRGEARETTWVFMPSYLPECEALLIGGGQFGVTDLSLAAKTARRLVAAPDDPVMTAMPWAFDGNFPQTRADDIFLRRLRLHHLRYAHRVGPHPQDPRRHETTGPNTVALAGDRLEISDCEILSSGNPIDIRVTRHSVIQRNYLQVGRNGWYRISGAWETVFQGNHIEGRDLEASYGGFACYDYSTELGRLYIADNTFESGFGGEREALTFDAVMAYPWLGQVSAALAAGVYVKQAQWHINQFKDLGVLVISGRGTGQLRRIQGNDHQELYLETPWAVIPDNTSVIAIQSYRRDVIVYHNRFQDASVSVQLWGGGYNMIIDSNVSRRTGGFWGVGRHHLTAGKLLFVPEPFRKQAIPASPLRGDSLFHACFFIQWLNNQICEGFVYPRGREAPAAVLGVYSYPTFPPLNPTGTAIRCLVIRHNSLDDYTRIVATHFTKKLREQIKREPPPVPVAQDIVIEANQIRNTPVGIEIGLGFEGVLLRDNVFENVTQSIQDSRSPLTQENPHDAAGD